jgi:phosphatidylinositol alpha-1,6-mannosyltransferase
MKSLLITFDFPPIVSGISTVFYHIWKYLPTDKCLTLAPRVKGCFEFDRKNKIKVFRRYFPLGNNILKKFLRTFLLYAHTFQIVRKEKINLLVCGQPMISGFIGLIFKKQYKIPYHVWVYGGEIIKFEGNKLLLRILRSILDNADKIITNSSYTTARFLGFGVEDEKLIKVSPAVDINSFRPDIDVNYLTKQYKLKNKKVIMTVGRLVSRKGNDMVIRSLKKVIEKIPDIRYVIIGEGPEKRRLQSLAHELKLEDYIVFTGFVSDEDLPKYYNLCDLYVLPNRETDDFDTIEGFGITFIEAGACGKPVIGGKSGGAFESVLNGVTGVLIDSQDTEMLASKIIEILSDKKLAEKLGTQGRERVLEEFSWEMKGKIVKNLL